MLVLGRRINETIVINGTIEVTVTEIRDNQVRLGFTADKSVTIVRKELIGKGGTNGNLKSLKN